LSLHFMVPGVLALLLMVITTVLGAMAIVREKELGTLEQLNVTPLKRWELTVGKLLPFALIGMVDVILVVSVAVLWFEIPLRGASRSCSACRSSTCCARSAWACSCPRSPTTSSRP
jgi:ABC-2 type transport system permease protein